MFDRLHYVPTNHSQHRYHFNYHCSPPRHQILVCRIYHPPNSTVSFNTALLRQICNLNDDYPRLLFLGNLNASLINWLDMLEDALAALFDAFLLEVCDTWLIIIMIKVIIIIIYSMLKRGLVLDGITTPLQFK